MKTVILHIKKNSKGFGLSLIYRGLDKYEEKDTGIFVARVVPGGMSEKYGLRFVCFYIYCEYLLHPRPQRERQSRHHQQHSAQNSGGGRGNHQGRREEHRGDGGEEGEETGTSQTLHFQPATVQQ